MYSKRPLTNPMQTKPTAPTARQAVTQLLQATLRVFSLYLCNGSYMEVTLRPLTRLNHWLRDMLNSRADIARIQRRACKLATSE